MGCCGVSRHRSEEVHPRKHPATSLAEMKPLSSVCLETYSLGMVLGSVDRRSEPEETALGMMTTIVFFFLCFRVALVMIQDAQRSKME